jgi:hypothetical protein
MRKTFTRVARAADALNIAHKLIGPDLLEVTAVSGLPPAIVLPLALSPTTMASGFADTPEEVELLWGIDGVPHYPDWGIIWMLSSPSIYTHPVELAKNVRDQWTLAHEKYEVLTNFTYAENHGHHKMILWLGGRFLRRIEHFGAAGLPFLEFASIRP